MTRLSLSVLSRLGPEIRRPGYDRAALSPGIVHLGLGAFHRAHQAVYLDDLVGKHPGWAIVGASLRSQDTQRALAPQDGLYTLAVRDGAGTRCRVIGSVIDVLSTAIEKRALLDLMAEPGIRIVSLTVTEKGYCHDPATGHLDLGHPGIVNDIGHPGDPETAPGLIVAALRRRRAAGIAPFTVLSCDNLPENGQTTRRVVTRLAELQDRDLGRFIAENVAFPSTMVDRIVPATTEADREQVASCIGAEDAWPVVAEPFCQWVIEDRFPAGRPPFEKAGAQMVDTVAPYEKRKLRMLNGPHSMMAYLGFLAGFETVAETIADPDFSRLIWETMTQEIMPTLAQPQAELESYREALLERFANPALNHRTAQIAMDGSQKLPQRLLATIRDRIGAGAPYARLALGVAGWIRYAVGRDEKGQPIAVSDPLAERLTGIGRQAGQDPHALVRAFLEIEEVFGTDLATDMAFAETLAAALFRLFDAGSARTVAAYASMRVEEGG